MNDLIKTPPRDGPFASTSSRPEKRRAVCISKDPVRALKILNKNHGANRFPIGYLPFNG